MKLYSFLGRLYFLIFIYVTSTTWAFPFEKRSATDLDLKFNKKFINKDVNKHKEMNFLFNIKDTQLHGDIIHHSDDVQPQEMKYTTHKYLGNVIKNRGSEDVSLAEALTENSEDIKHSSINMVLPIAGTLTVLFSMSILVAIFQCCCRKRQTSSESEDVKDSNDKLVDNTDSGSSEPKDERQEKSQGSENEEKEKDAPSIKNRIKAFEGVIPTKPSPGPVRPLKKRPESNAFKALENQRIVYGMGKSPSRLSKTPEDENQNDTVSTEDQKPEKTKQKTEDDDDICGYKQPENPDVVIADVDENDEFAVIVRDTSVLRSHKRAPPPKNRNRSSAAIRRHRARETTTDLLFNDSGSDNSFLMIPDNLSNKSSIHSDAGDSRRSSSNDRQRSVSADRNKDKINNKESSKSETCSGNKIVESSSDKKEDKKTRDVTPTTVGEGTPAIVTTDHSETNVIDLSKQQVPPEVFSGGNIFMHIDPTVKKNSASEEKKPATPPTRLRTSQLSVEERKEKAKSTPLLSSHEDLAKALSKLKSPSKENNSTVKNRSSSDLTSHIKM